MGGWSQTRRKCRRIFIKHHGSVRGDTIRPWSIGQPGLWKMYVHTKDNILCLCRNSSMQDQNDL